MSAEKSGADAKEAKGNPHTKFSWANMYTKRGLAKTHQDLPELVIDASRSPSHHRAMQGAESAIANYNDVWANVLGLAQRHIQAGETSLSRVLRLTEAGWRRMDLKPSKGTAFGKQ